MNYRFSLDDKIYADFIAFVRAEANGGSESKAMKLFAQNQYAIQMDRNLSSARQEIVNSASNEDEMGDSGVINLSGLDAAFSDIGE